MACIGRNQSPLFKLIQHKIVVFGEVYVLFILILYLNTTRRLLLSLKRDIAGYRRRTAREPSAICIRVGLRFVLYASLNGLTPVPVWSRRPVFRSTLFPQVEQKKKYCWNIKLSYEVIRCVKLRPSIVMLVQQVKRSKHTLTL